MPLHLRMSLGLGEFFAVFPFWDMLAPDVLLLRRIGGADLTRDVELSGKYNTQSRRKMVQREVRVLEISIGGVRYFGCAWAPPKSDKTQREILMALIWAWTCPIVRVSGESLETGLRQSIRCSQQIQSRCCFSQPLSQAILISKWSYYSSMTIYCTYFAAVLTPNWVTQMRMSLFSGSVKISFTDQYIK